MKLEWKDGAVVLTSESDVEAFEMWKMSVGHVALLPITKTAVSESAEESTAQSGKRRQYRKHCDVCGGKFKNLKHHKNFKHVTNVAVRERLDNVRKARLAMLIHTIPTPKIDTHSPIITDFYDRGYNR